jgi:long-chain acyl-CoA synthetase
MEKIWLKHYPAGVPAEINPEAYSSLIELFKQSCERFAEKPALSNYGCQLSYRELANLSQAFATYLQQELKLKKGDRVILMLPNVLQYPVALFGILQAGLIAVNTNPLYAVPELIHQVNDASAETIIVLNSFAHVVAAALPHTKIKHIIVTELGDLFPWLKSLVVNWVVKYIKRKVPSWSMPTAIFFKHALAKSKNLNFQPIAIHGDDVALLQYTGGTTGVPKGAMLTHRNMVANIEQVLAWVKPVLKEGQEIMVTALPLYHIFSLTANLLSFLSFGVYNVLITDPRDFSHFVGELTKVRFTVMTGVNTLFNALLNTPAFIKLNFSAFKIGLGGGAAVQRAVAERWQQVTGKTLLEGYGLTETSPVVCICPLDLKNYKGSIGLPVSSTDVTFRDDAGRDVPLGEAGELCVKGPQVMLGYWQQPEETKKIFTADGWLLTGDIGRMDADGFIYLLERKKDMILVSGFNVYPSEVEDVIAACPGVQEVAVIGIPDASSGEAVKACIIKKVPTLTEEAIRAYCHANLTGYKRPKIIEFYASLPKSPVGKILRKELREISKDVGKRK